MLWKLGFWDSNCDSKIVRTMCNKNFYANENCVGDNYDKNDVRQWCVGNDAMAMMYPLKAGNLPWDNDGPLGK